MKRVHRSWVAPVALMVMLVPLLAGAAVPTQVTYQGQLKSGGAPYTGTAQMKFAIVDGGVSLWSNDSTSVGGGEPNSAVSVAVANGAFATTLGAPPMRPIGTQALVSATNPILRVWVNTGGEPFEQLSDQSITSVPFSLQGGDGASAWQVSGNNIHRTTGFVGIGTATPDEPLVVVSPCHNCGALEVLNGNGIRIAQLGAEDSHHGALDLYSASSDNRVRLSAHTDIPSFVLGRVGIGTASPTATLDVAGTARASIIEITGADIAEKFTISEPAAPGTVLVLDPVRPGQLQVCRESSSRNVAGVVSGAGNLHAGVLLGGMHDEDEGTAVALSGRVWVHADATERPIHVGDLMVSAARAGHAAAAKNPSKSAGRILGKAMSNLEAGTGMVLILVSLQ